MLPGVRCSYDGVYADVLQSVVAQLLLPREVLDLLLTDTHGAQASYLRAGVIVAGPYQHIHDAVVLNRMVADYETPQQVRGVVCQWRNE